MSKPGPGQSAAKQPRAGQSVAKQPCDPQRQEKRQQRLQHQRPGRTGSKATKPWLQGKGQGRVDPPLLTAWLKRATSPEQLLQLVQQHAADLNHIHVSAAYTQAVRVCEPCAAGEQQRPSATAQQLLSELHRVAVRVQRQCGARELSNIIWSCGRLSSPATVQQLLPVFLQACSVRQPVPQDVANVLWAAANLQLQLTAAELQQLLGRCAAVLPDAAPQALSNTLWAVAAMGQQVPQQQLQRFLGRFAAVLPDATPQDVSNTLWAVATMGQQVPQQQLQRLLDRFVALLPNSSPQHVSNTLWAVATMGQQVPPRQLQLVLAAYDKLLPDATPQGVSNVLWACGKFLYVPQQLLQSLQQHPQQLQELITAAGPQELANIAWACGELGYKGQLLPGALLQQVERVLQDGGIGSFTSQGMCNLCWSAAVLDLQQCVPQVLQLAAAASQVFSTASDKGTQQLHQVHLWLLDSQLPTPGEGLSGVLTPQQLEQCRGSWEQQQTATAKQEASQLQQSVFAALLQLPSDTWQQQPQPEQPTADKACLIDIAAVTASGVKVAIEVEGPQHYVQPNRTLTGTTQSRNRALAARGYAVVSIPYWDWNEQRSTAQQQQYLLAKLQGLQR